MCVYRVFKYFFNFIYGLFLCHFFVWSKSRLKISCGFDLAVTIPKVMSRHKTVNALKKCFGRHCILERKISIKSFCVKLFNKFGVFENTLYLACIHKFVFYHCVVHRLDSEKVTGDKNRFINRVIYCKAEHTPELRQQVLLPFLKAVDKHLAVGIGIEFMSFFDKSRSQLLVVINLAVKGKNQSLVLVIDRLMTCVKVNN